MRDARRCLGVLTLSTGMVIMILTFSISTAPAQEDEYLLHLPLVRKPLPDYWARVYGGRYLSVDFKTVEALADGGLVLAGQDGFERWLVRLRVDGTIVWQKVVIDLTPYRNFNHLIGLSPVDEGGVILASTIDRYVSQGDRWYKDVAVLETDASGEILWQNGYVANQFGDYLGIRPTTGGYFLAANSRALTTRGEQDGPWLLKIGESGAILWQRNYLDGRYAGEIMAVDTTSDGGLLLAGLNDRSGGAWVFKVDERGSVVWQKAFVAPAGGWTCAPSWIEQTADQGAIVAGANDQSAQAGGCLMKLTASGDLSWAKGYNLNEEEGFHSVGQTADGDYIVSGEVRPDPNDSQTDAWLLRLNGDGEVLWSRRFGGDGDDSAYTADRLDDGYLVVGRTGSASDIYIGGLVLKVDGDGNIGNCDLIHPAPATVTSLSLVVSDTSAQAVTTAVMVDDPRLSTIDELAVMAQLCPADPAAIAAPSECGP